MEEKTYYCITADGVLDLTALTDRELDVFIMHACGLSTQEIADCLNRSYRTIEEHKWVIKDKLYLTTSREFTKLLFLSDFTYRC
jgi:DNA-binding NarL/FixJ family response regulator